MLHGSVLITGGAGTLGKEIIRRAVENEWDCKITIFSRDTFKHHEVKRQYPKVQSVIGDIRDPTTVYNVMAGMDMVIHAAAVKVIPDSEFNPIDTWEINVEGSMNILGAAVALNTPRVIGISTDKACHAANAYGATKYLMEKSFQEFARVGYPTRFQLCRYGNVLESRGSVIEAWKKSIARGEPIKITNPAMTRFWISPKQAVQIITDAIESDTPSGCILIPKMKALSVGMLAKYTVNDVPDSHVGFDLIPLRPGEKLHETLLTIEECDYAVSTDEYFVLRPTTSEKAEYLTSQPYTSDTAPELSRDELMELLRNE